MDDLLPFIVFLAVALINLFKTAVERSGRTSKPAQQDVPTPPPVNPTPFDDLFEEIAQQFKPLTETEEFGDKEEPLSSAGLPDIQAPSAFTLAEQPREPENISVEVPDITQQTLSTAFKAMPNTLLSFDAMRLPALPLMSKAEKSTLRYDLKNREDVRKAIIAQTIFSAPRAFDTTYRNSHLS
jgi:hypothetical protein